MLRPPPARVPTPPVHPYRIRAPLRFAGRSAALPPTRCRLPQWVQAPGRTTPRPTVHCCQPPLAVGVGSGTGQECSTPPPAPGRTRSDSTRSIRTPRLPVQPLAGSAGAALRKPVLHSCPYFITKIIARTDGFLGRLLIIHIDRLGTRLLRCGLCRQRCRKVHSLGKPREWRDLSMRKLPLKLRYRPRRVECPRCGVRVEDFPWAEPWARVTTALSNAVAKLARELSWQGTARQYGLNWKSVATIVKRAVQYGLQDRPRPPVHVIGIDEVSRRKGQVYLTVVYDLERRVLLWVGDDRTEEAVRPFFIEEMGRRRCRTLQVICMDMWAPYANLVKDTAVRLEVE